VNQPVSRLVYTGKGGNLFTLTPPEEQGRQLTWSWEDHRHRSEASGVAAQSSQLWPAWAPDGSRVAYFGVQGTEDAEVKTSVYVVASDGVESWELANLPGGMPIYGNWSPRGDAFAMLVQRGEQSLALEVARLTHPGATTALLTGAPLFWSWSPRGDLLAVHIGGSRRAKADARLLLLDAHSGQIVREVTDHPGEFRVPSWSPNDDLIAYVETAEENQNALVLFDVRTGEKGRITTTSGNIATVWSADGRFLAFGCTPRPGSSVISLVKIVDLQSGRITPLLDRPIASFFWFPQGDALLALDVDDQRQHLRWRRIARRDGETTELARFVPSREQTFIFSFFDQYAFSHPPLAPDGSALAFAGFLIGAASPGTTTDSQIYIVPLDRAAAPRPIAVGNFACWTLA
jgi:WD40 repeat protein